ncbi:MAG TPA: peroxiredoxin [Methanomassiliicoccales archaeon]|nr:peroxiredoxin [Methanomassiliicoccales archaeon]
MSKMLEVGDKAPLFVLPDQDGRNFDMAAHVGQQAIVLYFFPKSFTSGCTMEAHEFRDMHEQFQKEGAEVVGVSGDNVATQKRFKVEHELPFTLLADVDNKVRDMYGAWGIAHTPGRVTFVIDKEGMIRFVLSSNVQPKKHVHEGLRILKEISAK